MKEKLKEFWEQISTKRTTVIRLHKDGVLEVEYRLFFCTFVVARHICVSNQLPRKIDLNEEVKSLLN